MLIKLYYSTNLLHRSCQISPSDTHNTLLCYVVVVADDGVIWNMCHLSGTTRTVSRIIKDTPIPNK